MGVARSLILAGIQTNPDKTATETRSYGRMGEAGHPWSLKFRLGSSHIHPLVHIPVGSLRYGMWLVYKDVTCLQRSQVICSFIWFVKHLERCSCLLFKNCPFYGSKTPHCLAFFFCAVIDYSATDAFGAVNMCSATAISFHAVLSILFSLIRYINYTYPPHNRKL